MAAYERKVGEGPKFAVITGSKCDRCGFTQLDSDDDVWSAVGL
jgi:hypothetical protein